MRIRLAAVAANGGAGSGRRQRRALASCNREPAPGAHLETSRIGYRHHGVYVGGGRVVHYVGFLRSRRAGVVEETTLAGFAVGHSVRVVEHPESHYSAQEIIDRARSRVGEREYRLLDNNCEHFCNWCITGLSRSLQAQRPVARVIQAVADLIDQWSRISITPARLRATLGQSTGRPIGALPYSASKQMVLVRTP
jgi:lecithin:retinol acyltransferase